MGHVSRLRANDKLDQLAGTAALPPMTHTRGQLWTEYTHNIAYTVDKMGQVSMFWTDNAPGKLVRTVAVQPILYIVLKRPMINEH